MLQVVALLLRPLTVACLLLVPGCAGLGKPLEPPRVSLADVRIQEIRGLENVFQIDLRVFNTNDLPLTIKAVDCDLTLNGKRLATGVSRVEQEIPALGTAVVPVTLYASVVDWLRGVMGLQEKDKIQLGLSGKLRIGGGPWVPSSIPFNAQSEFSLDTFQKTK